MTPAKKDCDQYADGYAGKHGGFAITWQGAGWWVVVEKTLVGPFHTSQAAFGAVKDAIDEIIVEENKCADCGQVLPLRYPCNSRGCPVPNSH